MSFFNGLVTLGAAIGGGLLANRAANRAADAQIAAAREASAAAGDATDRQIAFTREQTERALELFEAARDRGLEALDQGTLQALTALGLGADQAQKIFEEQFRQTEGSFQRVREISAERPEDLTPSQRIQLEDIRRDTMNSLDRSSLRGAGRAGQAVLADLDRRFRAGAHDSNRDRSDRATFALADAALDATNKQAALNTAVAGDTASLLRNRGADVANLEAGFSAQSGGQISQLGQTGATALASEGSSNIRSALQTGAANAERSVNSASILGDSIGQGVAGLERFFAEKDDQGKARGTRYIEALGF